VPKLGLRPYAVLEDGLEGYLGYNFNRLENVFERIEDVLSGTLQVTGDSTFATGLTTVTQAVACLRTDPTANAAYVTCVPQAGGTIRVRVFTSGFALSVTAVFIQWMAAGELTLT